MITQLEKEVTLRFLKTKKNDGFLNIISVFSFVGISLGVAVLIIVMSVMNGFRTELINKIVGFNAHAVIQPVNKPLTAMNVSDLAKILFSNDGEAIILNKDNTKGVFLKGYLTNDFKKLQIVNNNEYYGSDDLDVGDTITLMSPVGVQTLVGTLPKQEMFKIISIFDSSLSDYNENIAYINLETLESFFNKKEEDRFLELYFKNPKNIEIHKKNLIELFPNSSIYTWSDVNKSLFTALKVERNVMFIIVSLIIIVAAFNIISGLTILVKNKTRDIGILKSIGVSNKSIKKIFFYVGFFIGTSATIFGVIVGTLFSIYIENIRIFISNIFDVSLFPEDIYILNSMPSEININSIIIISFCSIITTILVSIYPAAKAASLDTIKTLKYE